jgi:hypothetical protein
MQLNIVLEVATIYISTGGEVWDNAGCTTHWSAADNYPDISHQLNEFSAWSKPDVPAGNPALWQMFDDCFAPPECGCSGGTAGLAWVGTLCSGTQAGGNNAGVTYQTGLSGTWKTFAHEVGHNFDASHSFEDGQGFTGAVRVRERALSRPSNTFEHPIAATRVPPSTILTPTTLTLPLTLPLRIQPLHLGGIMDYGDGIYKGVSQFNTQYRKNQVCAHVANQFENQCSTSQIGAWAAVCGDGIIDAASETCECVGTVLGFVQVFWHSRCAIQIHDVAVGLKPGYMCDVISVLAEFMVDVAVGLKPNYMCAPMRCHSDVLSLTRANPNPCRNTVGKATSCAHCNNCQLAAGKECTPEGFASGSDACCGTDGMLKSLGTTCTAASGATGHCSGSQGCLSSSTCAFFSQSAYSAYGITANECGLHDNNNCKSSCATSDGGCSTMDGWSLSGRGASWLATGTYCLDGGGNPSTCGEVDGDFRCLDGPPGCGNGVLDAGETCT